MKKLLFVILCLGCFMALHAQERKYIRQGNKEYAEGVYDESEILYRRALEKNQDSYTGNFNLGGALYKQEKYEDAARKFNGLAEKETNRTELGRLYHNLGNSMLQARQIEASIEAYKEALRNNPGDDETRHNLAYAQQLLQEQQQQQQQQEQNQDQNQENRDQEDSEDQDQENQQQEEQQPQDQENQQARNEEQEQEPQPERISREDAERMLQALAQEEQKLQEKLKKQQAQARRVKVLKDW